MAVTSRRLMRPADVAEMLGVSRQQVHVWAKRRQTTKFPEPTRLFEGAPLYSRALIVKWHNSYVPALGGRRKPPVVDTWPELR